MYKIKLDDAVLYYPGDKEASVINPELNLQTGYAGELTLKVPPVNPLYNNVKNRMSMISVFRDNTEIFYGEVRTREKDRFKNQSIKATGALSFLADTILPQREWHDIAPRDLLDAWLQLHNSQVEDRKKIYIGTVTIHDNNDSLYRITNRETTLEAIREKLVDRLGGYLRLRHEDKLYLDWITIEEYGKYCEQPIQFGSNLLDYSETMTADDVATAVIPLGAAITKESSGESEFDSLEKNVDITSVNDGKDYIYSEEAVKNFGWVFRTAKWDDVTVPTNLLKRATEYLETTQYESLVMTLTAVDLSLFGQDYDSFDIGDRVLCNAPPYGMKKVFPIMEMKIPLQQPDQAQLTLGESRQMTLTEQTSGKFSQIRKETTDAEKIQSEWMKSAIDNLTKQMTGNKGGYKLTEYDENGLWIRDLYMDAPDKEKATKLLQINVNGIAGSSNGYAGPYTVGMTLDGQIVGERILTGSIKTESLSADCISYIETKISDGDSETEKTILKQVESSIKQTTNSITLSIESLEQKLEKKSGNWYGNYEPTSNNNPATSWNTDELKKEHERDIFFNTTTGYAYQYVKNNKDEYGWIRIKDKDIEAAQSAAEKAMSKIELTEKNILLEVSKKYTTTDQSKQMYQDAVNNTTTQLKDYVSTAALEAKLKVEADSIKTSVKADISTSYVSKDDLKEQLTSYATTQQVQSAINQQASSITAQVTKNISQTYITKSDVEVKFENAEKDWESAANTAKSEAISAAATDATTKANKALKDAISTAANDATDKANKALEDANNATDGKLQDYTKITQMQSAIQLAADQINMSVYSKVYYNYCTNGSFEKDCTGWIGTAPNASSLADKKNYTYDGRTCALITYKGDMSIPNSAMWRYELENKMPIEVVLKLALKNTTDQEKNSVEIIMDGTTIKTIPEKDLSKQWTEVAVDAVELEAGTHELHIKPTKNGNYGGVYITDVGIYAYRSDQTEAKFSVLSDSISSEIARAKGAEEELSSSIKQTASSISTKVEKNGIISAINQTAETISIKASKIDFNGMITANSYFQIKTDGSFVAKKGTIGDFTITGGSISTGYATISMRSHAIILKNGLEIRPGSGAAFSDGSDAFKVFNLNHVTSGGHIVFGSDGATVSYLSSSSKRYKDHVTNMTLEEAEKILSIPVVWFIYKAGYLSPSDRLNGKKLPGLYAEDVYSALPEAAQINENGEVEDWNFRVIIPAMLKLIQNLYERV